MSSSERGSLGEPLSAPPPGGAGEVGPLGRRCGLAGRSSCVAELLVLTGEPGSGTDGPADRLGIPVRLDRAGSCGLHHRHDDSVRHDDVPPDESHKVEVLDGVAAVDRRVAPESCWAANGRHFEQWRGVARRRERAFIRSHPRERHRAVRARARGLKRATSDNGPVIGRSDPPDAQGSGAKSGGTRRAACGDSHLLAELVVRAACRARRPRADCIRGASEATIGAAPRVTARGLAREPGARIRAGATRARSSWPSRHAACPRGQARAL